MTPSAQYSVDEYLQIEECRDSRSEYFRGEIVAMSSGTINHNRITRNILVGLHNQLSNCGD